MLGTLKLAPLQWGTSCDPTKADYISPAARFFLPGNNADVGSEDGRDQHMPIELENVINDEVRSEDYEHDQQDDLFDNDIIFDGDNIQAFNHALNELDIVDWEDDGT